jgi:hypothetical protein
VQRWLGDLIQVQNLEVTAVDSTLSISIQYLRRTTSEITTVELTRTV